MKFSIGLLAAATLATAAPIRLIVISSRPTIPSDVEGAISHLRFGHAAAQAMPNGDPRFTPFSGAPIPVHGSHTGCLRSKMKQMSDAWRKMFGFEPIKDGHEGFWTPDIIPPTHPVAVPHPSSIAKIRILPYIPPSVINNDGRTPWMKATASRMPVDHNGQYNAHIRHASFLHRLHHAMTLLTPWEGRAVSFVFGCGLGVLIRMVYVLILVLVRSRKAKTSPVALPEDGEEQAPLYVAPPNYVVDEKKELPTSAEPQVPATN
ncbi:hypothetical protein FRC03_009819 [Tulasnella sp. 419]|nr:hypothetical protein FRC03_009819 [Tulasnella sp. 419]